MQKKRALAFLTISSFAVTALMGCNQQSTFTIEFRNYDGELLEKYVDVEKGTEVSYTGNKPVHYDDSNNYYVFDGWDNELTEAKKDITYTAVFTAKPLTTVEETPDSYKEVLPSKTEDGTILHAFCWKYSDVLSQLPYIARAGYKSVQLSPVQTPKSGGSSWWAFYQPLSFRIADGGESPLGDKEDLKTLCDKAEEYGISIIVDIVFNHLANIGDSELESDGTPKVSPNVEAYEPYIYAHRNDTDNPTFHHNPKAQGSGAETQYYPYGKLPDLNTGNTYVQGRALDLLKECIDVGVDGFRFDAAKHIETPDDPDYPSDFWPNTLGVAKEYYKSKTGNDLFAYGEVLGKPSYRTVDVYTKYMHVSEGNICNGIEGAASDRKAIKAVEAKYGQDTDVSNLVAYMETHDTYVEDDNPWSDAFISRCWAALNGRKDVRNLYLARPDSGSSPSVGIIGNYFFRNELVGAVNRFHNRFIGAEEYLMSDGSIFINERVSDSDIGAVVVDFASANKIVVDFAKLGTGVYYDQLTGKAVTIRDGHATINLDKSGICVLTKSKNEARPTFEIDNHGGLFAKEMEVNVAYNNATKGVYQINGGTEVEFNSGDPIKLTASQAVDNKINLTITVSNEQYSETETFTYEPVELVPGYYNVLNVNPEYFTNNEIYMWSWKDDEAGKWSKDYTVQGNTILVDVKNLGMTGMVFGLFAKDYVISNVNEWDNNVIRQTTDISGSVLERGYYDGSRF